MDGLCLLVDRTQIKNNISTYYYLPTLMSEYNFKLHRSQLRDFC